MSEMLFVDTILPGGLMIGSRPVFNWPVGQEPLPLLKRIQGIMNIVRVLVF
jgi:hypothetical protein